MNTSLLKLNHIKKTLVADRASGASVNQLLEMEGNTMNQPKRWVAASLLIAGLAIAPWLANAAPIVSVGSTYDIYIEGEASGNPFGWTATFDEAAETNTRAGLELTLTETATDLGGGTHLISILFSANGELFPVIGEGAIVGLGTDFDGIDLLRPVYLNDARIMFFTAGSSLPYFTSSNLADDYRVLYFGDPWSGFFPAGNDAFINGNAGGKGINAFSFRFNVSEIAQVPEPATMLLLGVGFVSLYVTRRRSMF